MTNKDISIEDIAFSESFLENKVRDSEDKKKSHVVLIQSQLGSEKRTSKTYVRPSSTRGKDDAGFVDFEYPLLDISAAEDTETYVFQALLKKQALAIKEGFSFVGENVDTIKYVKERLQQLEVAQDQTFSNFIEEIMSELFKYHAVCIVKSRNAKNSGGNTRKVGDGKYLEPVAAYFVISINTMKVKVGGGNRITHFKHSMPDGREKIFKAEDVIYITINKRPHFLAPTPPWHPALEDIEALRRIEESVENLVYQHIHPLFVYKVGTEKEPVQKYEDGSTEIDYVKFRVDRMPSSGMVVVPYRHDIEVLGSESQALRVEPYLDHFKKRVVTGTGMSSLDFGDGEMANRSTSDSLSRLGIGNVKFYQNIVADRLNFYMIRELLLEGKFGFNPLVEEHNVKFSFKEVDTTTQITVQNHFSLLYEAGMMTLTEARNASGYQALRDDQNEDIKENPALITARAAEKSASIRAAAPDASSPIGSGGSARARQQPSNQHGTLLGPTKARSSQEKDRVTAREAFQALSHDLSRYNPNNIELSFVRQLFLSVESKILNHINSVVEDASIEALRGFEFNKATSDAIKNGEKLAKAKAREDVRRLISEGSARSMSKISLGRPIRDTLDVMEYRISSIMNSVSAFAYNTSRVRVMKAIGIKKGVISSDPNGQHYSKFNGLVIDLLSIEDDQLPPFHSNCRCEINPFTE
jgi:hypothetical protein